MAEIEISRDLVRAAAQQPAVRQALRQTAQRVARRAESLAAGEGVGLETWTEESSRTEWRPRVIVYGDNAEQEFGSTRQDRRRIMGRAAEEG